MMFAERASARWWHWGMVVVAGTWTSAAIAQQPPRAASPPRQQAAPVAEPRTSPAAAPQPSTPRGAPAATGGANATPRVGAAANPAPCAPNTDTAAAVPAGGVRQPAKQVQFQQAFPPLTKEQEAELNHILAAWERESDKVKTLTAPFSLWEYDLEGGWGKQPAPGEKLAPKREATGLIHFAAPDKGSYEETDGGERWMCDGQAIYEFNRPQKTVKEYRLPEELKGKAITKGPLPFVFGAKADTMKHRYFMRVITPVDVQGEIWVEAWPRLQQDAANFHHVQVILDAKVMLPTAIRMYMPNPKQFKVYSFANPKINDTWDKIKSFFDKPRKPAGWQWVVEEAPQQALPQPPATATRPGQPAPAAAARPGQVAPPPATAVRPGQGPTADTRNPRTPQPANKR